MASPNTALPLSENSQKAVIQYLDGVQSRYISNYNIRAVLEQRDRAYYREEDRTTAQFKAKNANAGGDANKIQNITVPVVFPQVDTNLAYMCDVFLTGYPIFATVAPPVEQEGVKQFDACITDNSIMGGWPSELKVALLDGLKYDFGAVEVVWEKKKVYQVGTPQLDDITRGVQEEVLYEGNFIKRLDPYNLILDTRVSPDKNHKEGEIAGYTELLSAVATKMRMDDLDKKMTMNYRKAFEDGSGVTAVGANTAGYYIPQINNDALLPTETRVAGTNWFAWAGLDKNKYTGIQYHDSYEWTVIYCRIIPALMGMQVPEATKVQIWKFIIINRKVVIYAERQTNAHNFLPIIVCKPSNDGMSYQSKSFGQNAEPYQSVASGLMNSVMASQRRKVYDRILYDPTKVRKEDIDNTDPVARIPIRNVQFGKGFEGAVQQMPYHDEGIGPIMQMVPQVVQMAEIGNGQNRVQQGQFQKGNKTRREFEGTMAGANSRQQMTAIGLEYTFFMPIKHIIKTNILQFQPPKTILSQQTGKTINIDPNKMRQALISFKISDGLLSSEKLASLDVAGTIVQAATQLPMVDQMYDVMGILAHTWKLQGIDWIDDFKRGPDGQAQYLTALAQNTEASGTMRNQVPPPQPAAAPDAGARGALQ